MCLLGRPSVARSCAGIAALAIAGCAVNDHGFVRVERRETPTASIMTLSAVGAHLSTYAADRGLSLGWVERTYAMAKPDPEGSFAVDLGAIDVEWHRVRPAADDSQPTPAERDPILVAIRRVGLSLDANAQHFGLMLGFQERAAIRLPTEGNTVLFVRVNLHDLDTATFLIGGDRP
jgi:hypothetical protein